MRQGIGTERRLGEKAKEEELDRAGLRGNSGRGEEQGMREDCIDSVAQRWSGW